MLLFTVVSAHAMPCGTVAHLDEIAAAPRPPAALAGPTDGERELRDPFEVSPHLVTTEHFAIRWGPDQRYSIAVTDMVAAELEWIWDTEIGVLGWPEPPGSDAYRINVYMGNSGGGAPEISFAAAYVTVDEEGYPYIVVNPDLMLAYDWGDTESVPATLAHEFMHVIQTGIGGFLYEDRAGWFWEASAEWMVPQVYPESPNIGSMVGAYTVLPHVSLDHFDYPDTGALVESHHYGAEIFLAYLSEHAASEQLVMDTWLQGGPEDVPLEVIDGLLQERGTLLGEAFLDFATRNVTFDDYAYGSTYAAMTELYVSWFGSEARRWTAELSGSTEGWDRTQGSRPWAWGYNHIHWREPGPGLLRVALDGNRSGSDGTPTVLYAAVVTTLVDGYEVHPLLDGGTEGEMVLELTGDEDALTLVVAATPDTVVPEEYFGYRFDLSYDEKRFAEATDSTQRPIQLKACGCATGGAVPWWGLMVVPLLGLRRRA